jgi:hypothetical protein
VSAVKADTRVEDPAQAETEARYANLFGSWRGFMDSKPARRWVRTDKGWSSFDPVIVRIQARNAMWAEARKKREDEKAAKKAARLAKIAA